MRSSEALKDSLQKRNKKKHKSPKKVIITDLIILAYKQRCTRDGRDCQREQNPKRWGVYIAVFLLPMPWQTHSGFSTASKALQPVGSAAAASFPLCQTMEFQENNSTGVWTSRWHWSIISSKISPACSGDGLSPRQRYFCYFCPRSSKRSTSKQSTRLTVLFCSDQRCLFHPLPWPTHTTEHFGGLSKRLHSRNLGWSNTLNAQCIWLPRINYVPRNPNDFSNNFLTELKIPTKGRSPLMSECSSVGIRDTVFYIVLQQTEILYISTHLQDDQNEREVLRRELQFFSFTPCIYQLLEFLQEFLKPLEKPEDPAGKG